jgi:hypothetical protein
VATPPLSGGRGPWSRCCSPGAGLRHAVLMGAGCRPPISGLGCRPVIALLLPPLPSLLGGVPVGSPALWQHLLAFGFGMGTGWRRKPMTATSSGAVHLLGCVILSPFPSYPVGVPGENVDHVGRTTTALMASLPPWRRRFGSFCWWRSSALLREFPLQRPPSFSFFYIIRVALVVSWRTLSWWTLCRPSLRWRII